jgi:hypothetical protein
VNASINRRISLPILSALLLFLALFPTRLAASVLTLAWDSNTEWDLDGYKIYYGTRSRDYDSVIDVGDTTYHTIRGLEPETRYYLALTAYDISYNESDFSGEVSGVSKEEQPTPNPYPYDGEIDSEDGYSEWGCFIATASFGSYLNPHVKVLRDFRDAFLIPNSLGRKCVRFYYQHSPRIAKKMGKYGSLRFLSRQALLPLIGMSSLSLKTTASPKIVLLPFPLLLLIFTITFRSYLHQTRSNINNRGQPTDDR